MAKKHRRTRNPDISLGWVLGGLAVVGYGIYWYVDYRKALAAQQHWEGQAAIEQTRRLYDAGLLGGYAIERPQDTQTGASASQMKEHMERYEQGRAGTV